KMRGWLALPDERFVVSDRKGRVTILDTGGAVVRRSKIGGVQRVSRCGSRLLLGIVGHVWITDLELRPLWEVSRPDQTGVLSAHPGGGAIYWAEGRDVFSCASDGEPRTIATLPQDMIIDAIDRHERVRGRGPLVDPVLRRFPGVWR